MLPRSCLAYAKRVNSFRLKVNRSGGGAKMCATSWKKWRSFEEEELPALVNDVRDLEQTMNRPENRSLKTKDEWEAKSSCRTLD
jgi:hypothetical protein